MTKIAIQPNASGTGVFTLTAPNSNTDRTFSLPDATGEVLTTAGGTFTGPITGTDLTLSNGVYLGGTGSANLLDDYEEGTWTPVFDSGTGGFNGSALSSISQNKYVKVGNVVHIAASFAITGGSNISAGDRLILTSACLPFTPEEPSQLLGVGTTNSNIIAGVVAQHSTGGAAAGNPVVRCIAVGGTVPANTGFTHISITYRTA